MRRIPLVLSTLMLCLVVSCSTSPTGRSQFLIISPESAIQQSRGAYQQAVEALRDDDEISQDRLLESRVRRVTMGKFDIIFCRNVLIYFSPEVKAKIISQFAQALNPKGYLFLGASESMAGLSDSFDMVRCNPGIIYQKK